MEEDKEKTDDFTSTDNYCDNCECDENTLADISQIKSEFLESEYEGEGDDIGQLCDSFSEPLLTGRAGHRSTLLRSGVVDLKITPFHLCWSFGMNCATRVLNLTTETEKRIFYTSSLSAVMYNYSTRSAKLLQGHANAVSTLSCDRTGRWLVTGDAGPENTIIVWDSDDCMPVFTIFEPFSEAGIGVVAMSDNGKYLIAVSLDEEPIIKFWLWTFGKDDPDDIITVKSSYGKPVGVSFNQNVQEHIMVALENHVLFFCWDVDENKLVSMEEPSIRHKKIGSITDCAYANKCHECYASTETGCVLIFGCTYYVREFESADMSNHKIYVKAIKTATCSINCILSIDDVIITGDEEGHIHFYDKRMRILYWFRDFELPSIVSISFNLEKKRYQLVDVKDDDYDEDLYIKTLFNISFEDRHEEYEKVFAQNVPKEATLEETPFIMRDFIISTIDGVIHYLNFLENTLTPLMEKSNANVCAMDVHTESEYLLIAYEDGRLCLFNYLTHLLITEYIFTLPIDTETEEESTISYVKYSPQSLHLACGFSNGELWILDTILLTPKADKPKVHAKGRIMKICFSSDSKMMAYYNINNTTCLYKYIPEIDHWQFCGKIRAHYKDITDIIFSPYLPTRLFTISNDRNLVEYGISTINPLELVILNKERIEQMAVPKRFVYYPQENDSKENYFLIADDQYKYKLVNDSTAMCRRVILGPAYGCYKYHPVQKMQVIERGDEFYLIFATDKHIGIQKTPLDCSPYKYAGMLGHDKKIENIRATNNGKYLFSYGVGDNNVLMWKINLRALDVLERLGGTELEPYFCLIEGGMNGWLFDEMQDLFYYMQILHQGENTMLPRLVNDYIPITELPDLMRACGYYPTEFEVETMIIDIKYRDFDITGTLRDEVSFLDFVQLYFNYRPAHGVEFRTLEDNFYALMYSVDEPQIGCINRRDFISSLHIRGEIFSLRNLHTCLATLMHHYEETDLTITNDYDDDENLEATFHFLPHEIDFDNFVEDILGIDKKKQTMEKHQADEKDDADVVTCI